MRGSNGSVFDGPVFSTSVFDRNGSSGIRASPLRSFNAQMTVVGEMASDGLDVDVVRKEELASEGPESWQNSNKIPYKSLKISISKRSLSRRFKWRKTPSDPFIFF